MTNPLKAMIKYPPIDFVQGQCEAYNAWEYYGRKRPVTSSCVWHYDEATATALKEYWDKVRNELDLKHFKILQEQIKEDLKNAIQEFKNRMICIDNSLAGKAALAEMRARKAQEDVHTS